MESFQESRCFFLPLDFAWSIQAEREKLELLERLVGESCRFVLGKTFRRSAVVVRNKEQPPLLWRYVWDILYITSSTRTSRGRKFPKGKELYNAERICL